MRIGKRLARMPGAASPVLAVGFGESSRFFLIRTGYPLSKDGESQRIHQVPAERSFIPWLVKIR